MSDVPVAVVGGGPAGLAAAFRLQQAGYAVRLFERETAVGGRTQTVRRSGFVINQGATILSTGYKSMLGIAKEAGLDRDLLGVTAHLGFTRSPEDHFTFDTDRLLRSALRFPLSPRARLTALKLAFDAARARPRMSYENLSLAADLDSESALMYGRRRLNDELVEELVKPMTLALAATTADVASRVDLLFCMNHFAGIGTRWLAMRGGMGTYADAVATRFAVTTSAHVTGVICDGDQVRVSWEDAGGAEHAERFAGCVLAVPARIAAAIHHDLDPSRRRFLAGVPYNAMTVVSLALRRPPPHIDSAFFAHPDTERIFTSVFEHNKLPGLVPPGRGLVSLYPDHAFSTELLHQDDDTVVEQVLDAGEAVLPPMRDDVQFATVRHWELGAFHGRVGYYRELRDFLATPDRLIQLAGDYFAPTSMNTASTTGERAARDLASALGTR